MSLIAQYNDPQNLAGYSDTSRIANWQTTGATAQFAPRPLVVNFGVNPEQLPEGYFYVVDFAGKHVFDSEGKNVIAKNV